MALSHTWLRYPGFSGHGVRCPILTTVVPRFSGHLIGCIIRSKWGPFGDLYLAMLILNGRMGRGKGIGEFTRDDTTSRSVVDYMIGTPRLFDLVQHFQVLDKFPESDHRAISLSMMSSRCIANNDKLPSLNWEPHTRYIWTRDKLSELTVTMIDGVSDLQIYATSTVSPEILITIFHRHVDAHSPMMCVLVENIQRAQHGTMLSVGVKEPTL